MMVLVAYDVNVESKDGRRRLRRVAKICVNYGQRVQNSVFECLVDPSQLVELKAALFKEIDPKLDSLRYYQLGKNWRDRVEHVGAKPTFDPEGTIVL